MTASVLMWEHHSWESPVRVGGRAFAEQFLAQGWRVGYLNGPLAPWSLWGGNDEVRRRRLSWRSGGEDRGAAGGRLVTYTPLSLIPYRVYPILDRPWFHRHSLDVTWPDLFAWLQAKGFGEVDLLWLATGSPLLPLLSRARFRRSLYRLSDETASFPDTPRSYAAVEVEAMRCVDLVVATALSLASRAKRYNPNVLLLPNGVDLGRFRAARERVGKERTAPMPRRVVYVGAIDSWFDTSCVAALARSLPAVVFELAGPARAGAGWASGLPNVRHLGPIPPAEVPDFLARADVGIIPFVDSPLTRAIHPVKLYEYFAAGLPVVASDLEEIRRIGSPALLARNDREWVDAVKVALDEGKREEFFIFAARHDWSGRFLNLMKALGEPVGWVAAAAAAEGAR